MKISLPLARFQLLPKENFYFSANFQERLRMLENLWSERSESFVCSSQFWSTTANIEMMQKVRTWAKGGRETLSIFRAANRVKVLLTPKFEVFKSIFSTIIINFPSHCECETWLKRTSNYWIKMCHILHATHHRGFFYWIFPSAKCRNFQRPGSRQTKIEIILKITLSEI